MTYPLPAPQPTNPRPGRSWRTWVAGVLMVLLYPTFTYGGYLVGKEAGLTDIWDPIWLRAYTDRPIDTGRPGDGFWVTGWYVDYDRYSLDTVMTRANHMDQIIIFGYGFDEQGNLHGKDQHLIKGVTGRQKRVLLFGNLTNGAFSRETAHAILTDPVVQARAISNILLKSEALGVSGVQIDFEEIPAEDRDAYTAFLARLRDELHAREMTLSIAAAAKTRDTRTGWGGATDYAAIGQIVDYFYLMAYDEHWRGGQPGPVASSPWVEQVVRYAISVIPSQKLLLGVPWYGYEWTVNPFVGSSTNRAYSSLQMQRRALEHQAQVTWDPVAGENVMRFRTEQGDRIAWFPDERSLAGKLKLAYQYNLKGIAIWRLGFESDSWWEELGAFRINPSK